MEEKKTFGERCREGWNRHKKKIKIAGSVIITLTGGYFLVKNWDEMLGLFTGLVDVRELQEFSKDTAEMMVDAVNDTFLEVVDTTREVTVNPHVMNLPVGKHASEAAKAFAEECGVILGERQTMRHGYVKVIAA